MQTNEQNSDWIVKAKCEQMTTPPCLISDLIIKIEIFFFKVFEIIFLTTVLASAHKNIFLN